MFISKSSGACSRAKSLLAITIILLSDAKVGTSSLTATSSPAKFFSVSCSGYLYVLLQVGAARGPHFCECKNVM